jgi:hypothetical protein
MSDQSVPIRRSRLALRQVDGECELMCRNVTGAQRELLKYYASVTSNRWLMLKIFGVLIIFVSFHLYAAPIMEQHRRPRAHERPGDMAVAYVILLGGVWHQRIFSPETVDLCHGS